MDADSRRWVGIRHGQLYRERAAEGISRTSERGGNAAVGVVDRPHTAMTSDGLDDGVL
ncbi:MAG TPA: hypothetical protein VM143_09890 [Acidimicrobiales bacterium]|nr:hypothetical protein [Acidimicrobiales bacterium]